MAITYWNFLEKFDLAIVALTVWNLGTTKEKDNVSLLEESNFRRERNSFRFSRAPTRHLGANKGYAFKNLYFIIKNHTLLSKIKCRGARARPSYNMLQITNPNIMYLFEITLPHSRQSLDSYIISN